MGAQADWDQTLAILKNYRDLPPTSPGRRSTPTNSCRSSMRRHVGACRIAGSSRPNVRLRLSAGAGYRRDRGVGKTYRRDGRGDARARAHRPLDPRGRVRGRSSGRRAAARARCCGWSPGCTCRPRARCASTARASTAPQTDLGIVFQSPVLLDWRTALANVLVQVELRGLDPRELPRARAAAARAGGSRRTSPTAIRTSCRAACASASPSRAR